MNLRDGGKISIKVIRILAIWEPCSREPVPGSNDYWEEVNMEFPFNYRNTKEMETIKFSEYMADISCEGQGW